MTSVILLALLTVNPIAGCLLNTQSNFHFNKISMQDQACSHQITQMSEHLALNINHQVYDESDKMETYQKVKISFQNCTESSNNLSKRSSTKISFFSV